MELTSIQWKLQKLQYIHNNPVNSGVVRQSEDYKYSSANAYLNDDINGAVKLSFIDIPSTLHGLV